METKEKNFVSAVIYVHNAGSSVENFLKTVISVLEDNFEHSEIICVNDCSEDNSLFGIMSVSKMADTASVSVVHMSYFHGLEAAMNAGADLSIGDFVFEFDNTFFDYDRSEVMNVYYRALQGYDIVSAVPGRREKFTSCLFYKVFDRFADFSYKMHTESFRILSRRVINRITSMNKAVPYRKAVYAGAGLKTDAVIYKVIGDAVMHNDKKEKNYRVGLAVDSLILFTQVGYRFAVTMTIFMMFMSVFMVIYSVVIYATAHPIAGWTTTILFLSVAFFGLFGVVSIVIKYLQLLVNLMFRRKQYSFESIEKLTK